jgi:hypothetical protein
MIFWNQTEIRTKTKTTTISKEKKVKYKVKHHEQIDTKNTYHLMS